MAATRLPSLPILAEFFLDDRGRDVRRPNLVQLLARGQYNAKEFVQRTWLSRRKLGTRRIAEYVVLT